MPCFRPIPWRPPKAAKLSPVVGRWLPRIAATAELGGFFAIERRLRKGHEAATLERGEHDRGSTMAIGLTFGLAMLGAPLTFPISRGRLPAALGWAGVAIMTLGVTVRAWAARTLGESYTRTLRVRSGQRVVDSGPYALVRHPGYAADILMWSGYGLAWTNAIAVVAAALPTSLAYLYRIAVEEAMLRELLGAEYERYAARTARLIPGIY